MRQPSVGCANGPQWNSPVDAVTNRLFRGHSLSDALGDTVAHHAGAVRIGIGKKPGQQHLVRTGTDARNEVIRLEGRLLDLGVVIGAIAVQRHPANFDQRIVFVTAIPW